MINGKKKGNRYEVQIANELTDLTGKKHYTNRYINQLADARKVDVSSSLNDSTPLNIQCKNTKNNVNYSKFIKEMDLFNQEGINIVFSKITNKGEYCILKKQDLYSLLYNNIIENIYDEEHSIEK